MRITIAERLRPFSHTPGMRYLLPGSTYVVEIYPCLLRFYDASTTPFQLKFELELQLKGLVNGFTGENNLERGEIKVWGETAQGFVRYRIVSEAHRKGIYIIIEKAPNGGIPVGLRQGNFVWYREKGVESVQEAILQEAEMLALGKEDMHFYQAPVTDRLSLGNHKAQDWDLIKRRLDLTEIFPVWHRLGQLVPEFPITQEGTGVLLADCQELIHLKKVEQIYPAFLRLFQAGFGGLLVPRLVDEEYQGIIPIQQNSSTTSPLFLLSEGAKLIRRLFIEEYDNRIDLLPVLPPHFHCGRLIEIPLNQGIVNLEWSKKTLRRMSFYATQDQERIFHIRHVRSFRLRTTKQDKGQQIKEGISIKLQKNCYYFFDNFIG